jgi:adenine-specific DNA-methyltransferase
MSVKEVTLKESMNKIVHTIMSLDEEKNRFVSLLTHYLNTLINNQNESEEYQKNLLKDFLSQVLPNNYINTYERIDLAIHNGAASESSPGVIFECKRLNNNSEMMSKRNLNTKAFQEIIYYYLKERIIKHNVEIKNI